MDWLKDDLAGARVLDLFAGTGALGLEALSRGAVAVDFVEVAPEALHALKANRASLRVTRCTRLFKKDAFSFLAGVEGNTYGMAFADPPYTSKAAERLVSLWLERPFSTILSVEHTRALKLPAGGTRKVLDDSAVTTYRVRRKKERG